MPIVMRKKYLSIFWKMAKSLWEDQEINFYWEIIGSATEGSPIKQETISVGEMFWNTRMMYFDLFNCWFYCSTVNKFNTPTSKFINSKQTSLTQTRPTLNLDKVGNSIFFTYKFRGGPV